MAQNINVRPPQITGNQATNINVTVNTTNQGCFSFGGQQELKLHLQTPQFTATHVPTNGNKLANFEANTPLKDQIAGQEQASCP